MNNRTTCYSCGKVGHRKVDCKVAKKLQNIYNIDDIKIFLTSHIGVFKLYLKMGDPIPIWNYGNPTGSSLAISGNLYRPIPISPIFDNKESLTVDELVNCMDKYTIKNRNIFSRIDVTYSPLHPRTMTRELEEKKMILGDEIIVPCEYRGTIRDKIKFLYGKEHDKTVKEITELLTEKTYSINFRYVI